MADKPWSGAPGPPPIPAAGDRVQRCTDELPVLHLEPEIPSPAQWSVVVDGLVRKQTQWPLEDIRTMGMQERTWALHCVWGWTRPGCRGEGVSAAALIDAAEPLPEAAYVLVRVVQGQYASCLTIEEARDSLLAWRLDGAELTSEHGGPLRFVPPPTKWGYKGVKWVGHLTLLQHHTSGFWEEMVGDPQGDVPQEVLEMIPTNGD